MIHFANFTNAEIQIKNATQKQSCKANSLRTVLQLKLAKSRARPRASHWATSITQTKEKEICMTKTTNKISVIARLVIGLFIENNYYLSEKALDIANCKLFLVP